MPDFAARYGPTAVITGAARGIGAGFARELNARGLDLVLTDIDAEELERTAEQIRARSKQSVLTIPLDMIEAGSPQALLDFSDGREVGLVICNHLYPGGSWRVLETDLQQLHNQIDANIRAYVDLAHVFGNRLQDQGRGGLILMSSLTAVVGSPYVTTYGATKAFILAFASGLGFELRKSGVDVLTLVPSSVNTETYRRSEQKRSRLFPPMEVEEFVRVGLSHLGKTWMAVPGRRNVLTSGFLTRLLPRQAAT